MRGILVTVAVLAGKALGIAAPHTEALRRDSNGTSTPSGRWPSGLHLAVDYYPSQWPESEWESDISQMRDSNISFVRINEFDWSVIEPAEGQYNFTLLDKSLELLHKYGIQAIVGTPTATPPNWITQKYDVSFVDVTNTTLVFGSRRHYSPSSFDYRNLSQTITQKLAERYGSHPAVVGWQLDNEFGCHDTVRSYDHNAAKRFRSWLEEKYGTIENMNNAQGRVFWSAQYESFDAVQPPFLEVYTTNELHTLDWYTFSSDMVIDFAKEQATILRQYSPDKAITTNMMMGFLDFDHYKFAREVGIDIATYDQYPLAGPSVFSWLSSQELADTLRTGLADWPALHQAIYRGVAGAVNNQTAGPFGIMELEPGMLNWGQYRVSPWDGMVKLWTLETFAASGDLVNYFRWRQVPYAQEQTLSGLHLSDYTADEGLAEVQDVVQNALPLLRTEVAGDAATEPQADVALIWDYASAWVWAIEPYSGSWSVKDAKYTDTAMAYLDLVYLFFSGLRRLGLSIDVIGPDQPLDGYSMVVIPSMPVVPAAFDAALAAYNGTVVVGPHTGAKTARFATTQGLNPGTGSALDARLPLRVTRVESPPTYAGSGVAYGGANYSIDGREEWIECARDNRTSTAAATYTSPHRRPGSPAVCANTAGDTHYVAFKPTSTDFLVAYFGDLAAGLGLKTLAGRNVGDDLGSTLRLMRRGNLVFAFNYGTSAITMPEFGDELDGAEILFGEEGDIPAAGVVVWKTS